MYLLYSLHADIKKNDEVKTTATPKIVKRTKNTRGIKKSNTVKTKRINKHSTTPCRKNKIKPKPLIISKEIEEKKILISIALNLSEYPNKIPFVRLQKIDFRLKKEVSQTILITINFFCNNNAVYNRK